MSKRPARPLPSAATIWELFDYRPLTGDLVRKPETLHPCARRRPRANNTAYRNTKVDGVYLKAHRVVWKWLTGQDPEGEIDHINRNGRDNRPWNLRVVTSKEQNLNRRPWGKGYKQKGSRWMVNVRVDGRPVQRSCRTEAEARLVADAIRNQRPYSSPQFSHQPSSPIRKVGSSSAVELVTVISSPSL